MSMSMASSSSLVLVVATLFILQCTFLVSASDFNEAKNYYSPDPRATTPPPSSGGHATPTPSHGGGSTPTPSYGGGSPPANCGNPPTPSHHRRSPPHGGYYRPSPPTIVTPPPTIVTPPSTPPTIVAPPLVPTPPSGATPPTIVTPPTTPIDPGTPPATIPSPPYPITPPFTCIFWRNHPNLIWGLVGWWGTVGNAFGLTGLGTAPGLGPGFRPNMNLLQALSNTRADGLGQLYREGTAALLNSMAHTRFPYTPTQVKDNFIAALTSNKAAANQAHLFKLANEGRRS